MSDLNARQRALLDYVATVFLDKRVGRSKTLSAFLGSIESTVLEAATRDLPAVGRALLARGEPLLKEAAKRVLKRMAASEGGEIGARLAGPIIDGVMESFSREVADFFGKGKR